eukprot:TRINITY_DN3414_c0_g1_i1.p1 TRINITY_DN3414_c0_g1~~TRINITY_DN3414_c0_g1_i1.p1  ORF type:complete len:594 (+),score=164.17 TRINITY_DN3414_c0_g1_i1:79-1860(+)
MQNNGMIINRLIFIILASLLITSIKGVYLPGVAPHDFQPGDKVDLFINSLVSPNTLKPLDFKHLPLCVNNTIPVSLNLGRKIGGSSLYKSNYQIFTGHNTAGCKVLCIKKYTKKEIEKLSKLISQKYQVNWIIDNLPAMRKEKQISEEGKEYDIYVPRFPLGSKYISPEQDIALSNIHTNMLYNHHEITIKYNVDPSQFDGRRIVGFVVTPKSIQHSTEFIPYLEQGDNNAFPFTCFSGQEHKNMILNVSQEETTIIWTYSVVWKKSPIEWEYRWDVLFQEIDYQVHWFSVFTSILFVGFLSVIVGVIIFRTCTKHDKLNVEDELEQTGWKLLHGDIFRSPKLPLVFSMLIGSGEQMMILAGLVVSFSALGLLSPPNRGGVFTAIVLLFVMLNMVSGYVSSRFSQTFKCDDTPQNKFLSVLIVPSTYFALYFLINIILWFMGSSAGVSFLTFLVLLILFALCVFLGYVGQLFALNKEPLEFPTKINQIPRHIPKQPSYNNKTFSFIIAGILPFGSFFIEYSFLLDSIWKYHFIPSFIFIFLSFVFLTISSAQISIIVVYLRLRCEGKKKNNKIGSNIILKKKKKNINFCGHAF